MEAGDGSAYAEETPVTTKPCINFKAPPFSKQNVPIWFRQVEAQFRVKGITIDEDKYDLILGSIETDICTRVSDIIINPPEQNKYQTLKERLISCFGVSEDRKLQRLFKEITLGDKKPSELLREMCELANNKLPDQLLKSLWMQHLPASTRSILLVSSEQTLAALVPLADQIHETCDFGGTTISAVESTRSKSSNSDNSHLSIDDKIETLTKQVEALSTRQSRSYFRSNSNSRERPNPRSRQDQTRSNKWMCIFHYRYGNKARKCEPPCKFGKYEKSENSQANH